MSVLIIAEAGVNHNGDLGIAKQLIDVAAQAGADLIKFQTFNAGRLVTRRAEKAAYQLETTGGAESQYDMLRRLELTTSAYHELIKHCRSVGLGFLSTAFDIESADFLVGLGLDRFKVPSGEITNLPYLRHVGKFGGEVILSTGMSSLDEVAVAIDILVAAGTPRTRIIALHCTTEYPVPMQDVNLRAMRAMGDALHVRVGYSDHTSGIEVAIAATALGAAVVEKHFTLDRALPGPDHRASLEPDELAAMVRSVRNVERAMGSEIKYATPSEESNLLIVRKSIVAARDIRAGEIFDEANLAAKRPGTGISPMRWDEVLGRRACRDFLADELIEL